MDQKDLIEQLKGLDWTKQEAELYIALLQLGHQPASVIAQRTTKNRITTYHALERLADKGIIERVAGKGANNYQAKAPKLILQQLEEKRRKHSQEMIHQIESLNWLMPFLGKLEPAEPIKPKVQLFYSEGLKEIYRISLEAKTMAAYFQPWNKKEEVHLNQIDDWHTKERVKRKIPVRIIIPKTKAGKEFASIKKELKQSITVSEELFPFQDITIITDEHILIYSQKEKLGISIESKQLAKNQQAIFNLAWEGAKALK